jgi:hypothetical protein
MLSLNDAFSKICVYPLYLEVVFFTLNLRAQNAPMRRNPSAMVTQLSTAWLDDAFVECLSGIHVWRQLQLFLLRWDRERGESVWWLPVWIPGWNNYTCMKIWNLVLLNLWVVCGLSQKINDSSWVALTFSLSVTRSCTSLLIHWILQNTSWRILNDIYWYC